MTLHNNNNSENDFLCGIWVLKFNFFKLRVILPMLLGVNVFQQQDVIDNQEGREHTIIRFWRRYT